MKARELYGCYQDYEGDFSFYLESETVNDEESDVMAILEEIERRLRHVAEEVTWMNDPELADETRDHADRALSDLLYIQVALDILEVMQILDEGEGDNLFWYFLRRLSWTDSQNLYVFWTQVREEVEEAD